MARRVKDPNGNNTTLEYDKLNRNTKPTQPGGGEITYTWDDAGNRASITAPDGTLTQYAYNANNQMTSAATGTETTSYTYYGTTQLRGIELPTGEETCYNYDTLGQITWELHTKNGADVRSYSYKYDELGRLTSETRDNIGNVAKVTNADCSVITYEYDLLGCTTKITYMKEKATVTYCLR
ncbi:MAG: hypothetical protein LBS51_02550 [Oscillospiraceae bacterium]|jgi:YD repeat-containing protein|nr:hypothetical protein [Oscillospiraceae bacterium]